MDRFVSTFTNRIDAKGRVSVPAAFRAILERGGYPVSGARGLYCYPALDAAAIDGGGETLAQKIDGLLHRLPDYSDELDQLALALYGQAQVLTIDGDGRIVLPDGFRAHAHIDTQVTFVGLGGKFQIWEPGRFAERLKVAREQVHQTRRLFAGARPPDSSEGGARGGESR
jgi:MraZ protein